MGQRKDPPRVGIVEQADWDDAVRRILSVLHPEVPQPLPRPEPHKPQTLVLLMTDLVGSSSASQRLGDAGYLRIMTQVNAALYDAVTKHGGQGIAVTGDGMLAVFGAAPKAVACALAIQDHMSGSSDLQKLKMRIGLAAGPVLRQDDVVVGMAVSLATRVCSLAEGGQILISEAVRLLCPAEGLQARDLGPVVLRSFAEPVRIYEIRRPPLP